jgi:hypothetical protein
MLSPTIEQLQETVLSPWEYIQYIISIHVTSDNHTLSLHGLLTWTALMASLRETGS